MFFQMRLCNDGKFETISHHFCVELIQGVWFGDGTRIDDIQVD